MQISRVCFITPPSNFLLDERVFMTLGILKVAAVVEDIYPVDALDLSGVSNPLDVIREYIASHTTEVYCITATTPQLPTAVLIIGIIRQYAPQARVVLGGPHTTLSHAAWRKENKRGMVGRATVALNELKKLADVLVAGDGEKAIHLALEENPPQLIDADDPATDLFLTNTDLETDFWPARHLVDASTYHYSIDGIPALSIISQLGCPFNCGFCSGRNSPSLRRMRSHSAENVIKEMAFMYAEYGTRAFMFYDDELNVGTGIIKLMTGITDLQQRLGVEFRLRGFVKSQLFTDEQAKLMYKAGFRWILIGFESGSPLMLDLMNKMATVEDNTRCMEIAARHGLKVKALMSMGHPGESEETVRQTRDWLLRVKPADFDLTVITEYPGSPYYDDSVPCPEKGENIWKYSTKGYNLYSTGLDFQAHANFYKGRPGDYTSYVFTDYLTPEDIVRLRDATEAEVRQKLDIPYPTSSAAIRYEHSMGMSNLPASILRSSEHRPVAKGINPFDPFFGY